MFYIINYFKALISMRFRGAVQIVFFGMFVLVGLNYTNIENSLENKLKMEKPLPYFHALISGKHQIESIQRRIISLPGVKRVRVKANEDLAAKAKEFALDFDLADLGVELSKFSGLQVYLNPDMNSRSFSLIREYISRLSGKDNVTFSPIKNPDLYMLKTKETFIKIIKKYGPLSLLALSLLLWVFSVWLTRKEFVRKMYLIEQYQRKDWVALKSFLGGNLVLITLLCLGILITFKTINIIFLFSVILFLFIVSLNFLIFKKWQI